MIANTSVYPFTGLLLALVLSCAFTTSAIAQDAASVTNAYELEEIVVTATRRAESIQDIALSVTGLTQKDLDEMGATGIQSYYRSVPNFAVVDRGPGGRQYSIRGISAGIVQQGAATVGVYIDEMPVTSNGRQPDLSVYDLSRVEVLRGPQGTLFGEGSMGGTVRMITPTPDTESFGSNASIDYSSTDGGENNTTVNGMINFAMSQSTALRLTGYYSDIGGFIDRVAEPGGRTFDFATLVGAPAGSIPPVIESGPIAARTNINGGETAGGRASFLWRASENLDLEINLLTQSSDYAGRNTKIQSLGNLQTNLVVPETVSDDMDLANLRVTYEFAGATLFSSTSIFDRSNRGVSDTAALGLGVFPGLDLFDTATDTDWFQDQISQELRLVSKGDGKLAWTAGLFYVDKKNGVDQFLIDNQNVFVSLTNILVAPFVIDSPLQILDVTGNFDETQYALYGEVDYQFNDQWSGTFGVRYYDYEQTNTDTNNNINILGLGLPDASFGNDENGTNFKFALSYEPNENSLYYALASEGFRIGGTNNAPGTPEEMRTYDSDSLWNYEIGNKSTFANGRVQVNSAVYYVDWTDIQVALPLGFSLATVNSGNANVLGAEIEILASPNDHWDISAALGLNKGELSDDTPGANDPTDPNPGFKGDRLPGTPDVNAAISIQYNTPISSGNGFARFYYTHTGDSTTTFNNQSFNSIGEPSYYELDAYNLLNLRLGYSTDHWTSTIYVNNMTNERADILTDNAGLTVRVTRNMPRTIGINFQYSY